MLDSKCFLKQNLLQNGWFLLKLGGSIDFLSKMFYTINSNSFRFQNGHEAAGRQGQRRSPIKPVRDWLVVAEEDFSCEREGRKNKLVLEGIGSASVFRRRPKDGRTADRKVLQGEDEGNEAQFWLRSGNGTSFELLGIFVQLRRQWEGKNTPESS